MVGWPSSKIAFMLFTFTISFAASCLPTHRVGAITVTTKPIPNYCGGEVAIKGTGFPPGHIIEIYFQALPGRSGQLFDSLQTADAQGNIELTHAVRCTTSDRVTTWPDVIAVAKDTNATVSEYPVAPVKPGIWVCQC